MYIGFYNIVQFMNVIRWSIFIIMKLTKRYHSSKRSIIMQRCVASIQKYNFYKFGNLKRWNVKIEIFSFLRSTKSAITFQVECRLTPSTLDNPFLWFYILRSDRGGSCQYFMYIKISSIYLVLKWNLKISQQRQNRT